jgi:SAM-dependent methyltransferase
MELDLGKNLKAGERHYRAFVGPPERYDLLAASQFALLANLGLREHHHLLDIGCGSCRVGRLFMAYLLPGRYCGLEPEAWLVDEGIDREVGKDILRVKQPTFIHAHDFPLHAFQRSFDYLLAQSVFSHASEELLRHCLREVRRVMKPSGIFAANFRLGRTTAARASWVYPALVIYAWKDLRRIIHEEGLACVPLDWSHPSLSWLAIVHPGQEKQVPDVGRAGGGLAFADSARKTQEPWGTTWLHRAWRALGNFRRPVA